MTHCRPKQPQPCIQNKPGQQAELTAFLLGHGGKAPRFDIEGTATILTLVQSQPRYVYLKVGSWLRCVANGRFMAHPESYFRENYTLVG